MVSKLEQNKGFDEESSETLLTTNLAEQPWAKRVCLMWFDQFVSLLVVDVVVAQ
jgi:hypothetical protein